MSVASGLHDPSLYAARLQQQPWELRKENPLQATSWPVVSGYMDPFNILTASGSPVGQVVYSYCAATNTESVGVVMEPCDSSDFSKSLRKANMPGCYCHFLAVLRSLPTNSRCRICARDQKQQRKQSFDSLHSSQNGSHRLTCHVGKSSLLWFR